MTRKKWYTVLFVLVICIICTNYYIKVQKQTTSNSNTISINNVQYKNIVDKIDNNGVTATFYYDSMTVEGLKTDTYIWEEKNFVKSDDVYRPTYANKYSDKSVEKLKSRLNLTNSPMDEYGQLYFYGNTLEFELFIFDSSRTGESQWKVFFLSDSTINEVDVKKDLDEVRLDSYQISDDTIYLYTRSKNENNSDIVIYKIDTSNYSISKIVIPLEKFEVEKIIVQLDKIFIYNNTLTLATSNYDDIFNGKGVILKFDLLSESADTIFVDYTINKTFPYNQGYLVLCNETGSFTPCIKFYDKEFKLIKSNIIEYTPNDGNIVIGARDYFYYLKDDKLYGSFSIDGVGNIDYLVVIDISNSEIVYLTEIVNQNIGYVLQDVKFHQKEKDLLIDLNSF